MTIYRRAINISSGSSRPSLLLFFSGKRSQVEGTRPSTPPVSEAAKGREVRARGWQPMRTWSQVGCEKWAGPPSIHPRRLRVRVRVRGVGLRGLRRRPGHRGRVSQVAALRPYSLALVMLFALFSDLARTSTLHLASSRSIVFLLQCVVRTQFLRATRYSILLFNFLLSYIEIDLKYW